MPEFSERYRLIGSLGRGAMGTVDLAFDLQRQEYVAIKRLRSASTIRQLRLKREFRLLASVRHPGIIRLYDLGLDDGGYPYVAMEHVRGVDLLTRYRTPDGVRVNGAYFDEARLYAYI